LQGKERLYLKRPLQILQLLNFENIDKTFQDYPTLIYDGPSPIKLASIKPKGITGNKVTIEEAKKSISKFFEAEKISEITNTGKNDSGPINTYSFKVAFKNVPKEQNAVIDVTQTGGQVYWMLYSRPSKAAKIDVTQAKALGKKFLEAHGYKTWLIPIT